jgi:hypothetical protein
MRTTPANNNRTETKLRRIAERQYLICKDVINQTLEEGTKALDAYEAPVHFEVCARDYGIRLGVDEDKLNQLLDEQELET